MEFNVIDSKAIAREQNALKRKYDKYLTAFAELPMRNDDRMEIEISLQKAFKNQIRDIVDKAVNGEVLDADFEEEQGEGIPLPNDFVDTTMGVAAYAGKGEEDYAQLEKMFDGTAKAGDKFTLTDNLKDVDL